MIDMPYYLMLNMTKESNINQKIQKQFARVDSQAIPEDDNCLGVLPWVPSHLSRPDVYLVELWEFWQMQMLTVYLVYVVQSICLEDSDSWHM